MTVLRWTPKRSASSAIPSTGERDLDAWDRERSPSQLGEGLSHRLCVHLNLRDRMGRLSPWALTLPRPPGRERGDRARRT